MIHQRHVDRAQRRREAAGEGEVGGAGRGVAAGVAMDQHHRDRIERERIVNDAADRGCDRPRVAGELAGAEKPPFRIQKGDDRGLGGRTGELGEQRCRGAASLINRGGGRTSMICPAASGARAPLQPDPFPMLAPARLSSPCTRGTAAFS